MPLQHISDGMLKRMHRLGDRKHLTKLVERIRTKIPGVFFRTAFIVGFPGETDEQFEELKQFVLDMEFDRVASIFSIPTRKAHRPWISTEKSTRR